MVPKAFIDGPRKQPRAHQVHPSRRFHHQQENEGKRSFEFSKKNSKETLYDHPPISNTGKVKDQLHYERKLFQDKCSTPANDSHKASKHV